MHFHILPKMFWSFAVVLSLLLSLSFLFFLCLSPGLLVQHFVFLTFSPAHPPFVLMPCSWLFSLGSSLSHKSLSPHSEEWETSCQHQQLYVYVCVFVCVAFACVGRKRETEIEQARIFQSVRHLSEQAFHWACLWTLHLSIHLHTSMQWILFCLCVCV